MPRLALARTLLLTVSVSAAFAATPAAGEFSLAPDASGRWAFIDAHGHRFFSFGVNDVESEPFQPVPGTQYYDPIPTIYSGDRDAWHTVTASRLDRARLNTVGAFSDADGGGPGNGFLRTPVLYVAGFASDRALDGLRSGFQARARANAEAELAHYPDSSQLLGVFLDNEANWWGLDGNSGANDTLLEQALSLPTSDEAWRAAIDFLVDRYGSVEALNAAYGTSITFFGGLTRSLMLGVSTPAAQADRAAFEALAAEAWFSQAAAGVREIDPDLLILGSRFAYRVPDEVVAAVGRHCDAVSTNMYRITPSPDESTLQSFFDLTGKPILITEFSWRAVENSSGNLNTQGAGGTVQTQAERADNYDAYVTSLAKLPFIVGTHWFEYTDQSPQGRFDGEDSNYGMVDIFDQPYDVLIDRMRSANDHAELVRTSVVANDGFEELTGSLPTGWGTFGNSNGNVNASTLVRELLGERTLKVFGRFVFVANESGAWQQFAAEPGQMWFGHVFAREDDDDQMVAGQSLGFIELQFRNAAGAVLLANGSQGEPRRAEIEHLDALDRWTPYAVRAVAPAGTASVRLRLGLHQNSNAGSGAIFFDEASLAPVVFRDVDRSGEEDAFDLAAFASLVAEEAPEADLDGSGTIDAMDLDLLIGQD
ncbi:MAG: hypothetical protein AAGI30_14070 [Planctomycetota bacterium]